MSEHKQITLSTLNAMRTKEEKIAMLTCYDASFATIMNEAGVEILLVGDSLGMVCQGLDSTLSVSINDMCYHTKNVARGNRHAFMISDMPFATYATPHSAFENAAHLMQAGAHMVKLEGGAWLCETIHFLTERAIPVCAHLGLTPQSVHQLGGYKVQGKSSDAAEKLKADALALQAAGARMLVLEAIPATLGKEVTALLSIPTIGIGAGPDCSGQVLVLHDLLGAFPGHQARFVKNFLAEQNSIPTAFKAYVKAVKEKSFPDASHCF